MTDGNVPPSDEKPDLVKDTSTGEKETNEMSNGVISVKSANLVYDQSLLHAAALGNGTGKCDNWKRCLMDISFLKLL